MNNTNQKRYYTPQFSNQATVSVRRLAWALNVSMPAAVDQIISLLPSLFSPSLVCPECKDKSKCLVCSFNQKAAEENAALLA